MAISPATKRTIVDVTLALVSQAILWYTVHRVFEMYGSERAGGSKASDKARQGAKKLERLGHRDLHLDEYEREIAAEIIHPDDIDVRFSDIAGLDPLIASLQTSVIFPLIHPTLLTSSPTAHHTLLSPPKGVILHGPPGCGKTMLAKALAKESGATFLNIAASVLTNKWFGESNKLVSALFRLARKTQPCIVFIDEIDSFLRERDRSDHEATAMMKAEFMTLWDGLLSGDGRDGDNRVLVLGATNRMRDIDAAFLRRMPRRFEVPLPDVGQREKILRLMLKDASLSPDLSLARLARGTPRFSSSDLKELCRNAAMAPVREMYARAGGSVEGFKAEQEKGIPLRPLEFADFLDQDGGGMQVLVDYDEPLD